jgi:hypothetical protein
MANEKIEKLDKCSCGLDPYWRETKMDHTNGNIKTIRVLCDCGKQTTKKTLDEVKTKRELKVELVDLWNANTFDAMNYTGENIIGGAKTKDGKKKVN